LRACAPQSTAQSSRFPSPDEAHFSSRSSDWRTASGSRSLSTGLSCLSCDSRTAAFGPISRNGNHRLLRKAKAWTNITSLPSRCRPVCGPQPLQYASWERGFNRLGMPPDYSTSSINACSSISSCVSRSIIGTAPWSRFEFIFGSPAVNLSIASNARGEISWHAPRFIQALVWQRLRMPESRSQSLMHVRTTLL